MVNLMTVGGVWGTIINWFNVGNFGWTIILFTITLKIALSPLDIFQRILTKKNAEKQVILQPQLEKLQKRYGNNKDLLNQKTMELYKKENFNVMGSCLGMLINLVLTLFIFLTLFSSLNAISQNKIAQEYNNLQQTYTQTLVVELDKYSDLNNTDENPVTLAQFIADLEANKSEDEFNEILLNAKTIAKQASLEKYNEIREGFLWIKNIYRPDTYASVFPSAEEYISSSGTVFDETYVSIYGETFETKETAKENFIKVYNEVTEDIKTEYSGWNGYLILVILSGVITLLSQFILQGKSKKTVVDKKGNETEVKNPNSNKLLTFLLPILMIIFTLQYSSAFALYIIMNSLMGVVIGFITNLILSKKKQKEEK